jgi:hypothetical protein
MASSHVVAHPFSLRINMDHRIQEFLDMMLDSHESSNVALPLGEIRFLMETILKCASFHVSQTKYNMDSFSISASGLEKTRTVSSVLNPAILKTLCETLQAELTPCAFGTEITSLIIGNFTWVDNFDPLGYFTFVYPDGEERPVRGMTLDCSEKEIPCIVNSCGTSFSLPYQEFGVVATFYKPTATTAHLPLSVLKTQMEEAEKEKKETNAKQKAEKYPVKDAAEKVLIAKIKEVDPSYATWRSIYDSYDFEPQNEMIAEAFAVYQQASHEYDLVANVGEDVVGEVKMPVFEVDCKTDILKCLERVPFLHELFTKEDSDMVKFLGKMTSFDNTTKVVVNEMGTSMFSYTEAGMDRGGCNIVLRHDMILNSMFYMVITAEGREVITMKIRAP